MSTFFDRHKRKSVLALLLLFLRRGGGLPLLLLVMVGGTALIGSNMPGGPIWLRRLIQRTPLGRWVVDSNSMNASRLLSLLNRARLLPPRLPIGMLLHSYSRASRGPNDDPANMVSGGRDLMNSPRRDRRPVGGETIDAVLTPEEAARRRNGVPLSEEEMRRGLLNAVAAGTFKPDGGVDPAKARGKSIGGEASGGWWTWGSVGFARGQGIAGPSGKLNAYKRIMEKNSISGAGNARLRPGGTAPLYKLFETGVFACLANPSSAACCRRPVPLGGGNVLGAASCSPIGASGRLETSAHTVDVPYGNSQAGGLGVLTSQDLGEPAVLASLGGPQQSQLDQANQMETALNICKTAIRNQQLMAPQLVAQCQQWRANNCRSQGSCCRPAIWNWFCIAGNRCSNCNPLRNTYLPLRDQANLVVFNACGNVGLRGEPVSGNRCP